MGPIAKYLRLARRDRRLLFVAARALASTFIGLRTVGFNAVREHAARIDWPEMAEPVPSIERIGWAVRAAGRVIPGGSNCLVRALATQSLLGRHGYRSDLRIGVRKSADGGIAGHAWLECDGKVVIGDFELDRYAPMTSAATT